MLNALCQTLWQFLLPGLFLVTGLVYSLGSGFFQFFGVRTWWRATGGALLHVPRRGRSGSGLSPVQALATALASVMGTGSIAGVASALTLGGPGALFWMWVTALLGMMTGCGEKILAVRYQRPAPGGGLQGGPMFYLSEGLRCPLLALLFSLAVIPATLAGGNLIQSHSIASVLEAGFSWDRLTVGLVTALAAGLVLAGGLRRVAALSSLLVPLMALLYLGSGALVLLLRASELPGALSLIFSCALSPKSAVGAAGGWSAVSALRWGVARGVFTNEAGLGTSAMAHGAADSPHPAAQGMWGIFEVCLSTMLVCSCTGLVILVSGVWTPGDPAAPQGATLTAAAFEAVLGPFGSAVVALSLLLFAFSSILGWSCYGRQALRFLTGGDRLLWVYYPVFLFCIPLGALWEGGLLWQLVDLSCALMALPNLTALLLLSPQALTLLNRWLAGRFCTPKNFSEKFPEIP